MDLGDHQMASLLRSIDADGNGRIDYSEFAASLREPDFTDDSKVRLSKEERLLFEGGRYGASDVYTERMKATPGLLAPDEASAQRKQRPSRKSNFFKLVDSDGSPFGVPSDIRNEVEIRRLREMLASEAEYKTTKIRDLFKGFDANGDGILTPEEFRSGLTKLGVADMAPERFSQLMQIAVRDRNGEIDCDEFVKVMRLDEDSSGQKAGEDVFARQSVPKREKSFTRVHFADGMGPKESDVLNQKEAESSPDRTFDFASVEGATQKGRLR